MIESNNYISKKADNTSLKQSKYGKMLIDGCKYSRSTEQNQIVIVNFAFAIK